MQQICPRCNQRRLVISKIGDQQPVMRCESCGLEGPYNEAPTDALFADVKAPGIFRRVDLHLAVGFSGPADDEENQKVHVACRIADKNHLPFLRPAIEVAMAMFAKGDPDGFEASLDKLCRGAMHAAGHSKARRSDLEEADPIGEEGGDSEVESGG